MWRQSLPEWWHLSGGLEPTHLRLLGNSVRRTYLRPGARHVGLQWQPTHDHLAGQWPGHQDANGGAGHTLQDLATGRSPAPNQRRIQFPGSARDRASSGSYSRQRAAQRSGKGMCFNFTASSNYCVHVSISCRTCSLANRCSMTIIGTLYASRAERPICVYKLTGLPPSGVCYVCINSTSIALLRVVPCRFFERKLPNLESPAIHKQLLFDC